MINTTFKINDIDLHEYVANIECTQTPASQTILTTLDGKDHVFTSRIKSGLSVQFVPLTTAQINMLYEMLSTYVVYVTYTNQYMGEDTTQYMRIDGDLTTKFALLSIDGNKYYTGLSLKFRQL